MNGKRRSALLPEPPIRATARAVLVLTHGLMAAAFILTAMVMTAPAAHAENRTLDLYFTHTKERLKVVYKRGGAYVPSGLRDLNRFLRDWRRNEATKMDPELFDLLWEVQQEFGGKTIHVVSAYRSPATNSMLRRRSRGVAKNSQHMAGKAIDFYIKGANIGRVREQGIKRQVGGVGYYPRSRSPFVHMDTGRVRAWPRMSRSQLTRLFPDGKTLHVPSNGKPLSGYKEAQALEKAGKLASLRGGSSFGVRSLFGFAGGGAARGGGRSEPGGIVRPTRGTPAAETAVAAADPPAARLRATRRERAEEDRKQPAKESAPVRATPPAPAREEREVRTASLGPATRTERADGEGGGLLNRFNPLPSVSLGGLIDRFSGDDDTDTPAEVRPVTPPGAPLTAVVADAPDAAAADADAVEQARTLLSERAGTPPPVPIASPRRTLAANAASDDAAAVTPGATPSAEADAAAAAAADIAEPPLAQEPDRTPATDDAPLVVAALPPGRPGEVESDALGAPALGYARADRVREGEASPQNATTALVSRPARVVLPGGASTPFADRVNPADGAPSDTPTSPAVVPTALAPVRGASPALIANTGSMDGDGWDMDAPDRVAASGRGVLLSGSFLGAPTGFGEATNWPSTRSFTGVRITVYAPPNSDS